MLYKVLIFLAVILALSIGAHLLFYKAVIAAFTIISPALKISLLNILVLLALSFMAFFILLQWHENPLAIGLYKFSAFWTGLFLQLLPAVLTGGIIIAAFRTQPCRSAFSLWVSDGIHLQRL